MLQLPPPASDEAVALAHAMGLTTTAGAVLLARGHREAAPAARFLDPKLAHLTSPADMKDRAEAVARLVRAVRARERVCVFGDYDADGITAAALVTEVLRALGAEVVTLLANRFDGGYGLSGPALARVLDTHATLLVTCDCGSSDHERLDGVRRAGLDAVVIDHHRVPEAPLPALAFLNPHRPECGFSYKGLASVGLALSIGAGVRSELGVALDMRSWLDFVAVGTIGDVAPLDGDNRALVRAGLAAIGRPARPGMRALAEIAGCTSASPTGEDVSFRLAPRINAPGRLQKPDLALALLLAKDDVEARTIAAQVEELCTRRKEVERAVVAEALEELKDPARSRRCRGSSWRARAGIRASSGSSPAGSRRASESRRSSSRSTARAAADRRVPRPASRSTTPSRDRAALVGFERPPSPPRASRSRAHKVGLLRDLFSEACAAIGVPSRPRGFDADARLEPGDHPSRVMHDLARFEPCGQLNPAPRVAIDGARVPRRARSQQAGTWAQLWIDAGGVGRCRASAQRWDRRPRRSGSGRASSARSGRTRGRAGARSR